MAHEVLIKASAERDIRRLPRDVRGRVTSAILALREESRPPGVRKLKGRGEEGWRIRVGDYRVVYQINDSLRQVTIYRVRHRRDVYRFQRNAVRLYGLTEEEIAVVEGSGRRDAVFRSTLTRFTESETTVETA